MSCSRVHYETDGIQKRVKYIYTSGIYIHVNKWDATSSWDEPERAIHV